MSYLKKTYASLSDDREVVGPIDYSKRRGALEEINQAAIRAEREMIELRAAEQSLHQSAMDAGPVELTAHERPKKPEQNRDSRTAKMVSPGL